MLFQQDYISNPVTLTSRQDGSSFSYVAGLRVDDPADTILAFGPEVNGRRHILFVNAQPELTLVNAQTINVAGGAVVRNTSGDVVLDAVRAQLAMPRFMDRAARLQLIPGLPAGKHRWTRAAAKN